METEAADGRLQSAVQDLCRRINRSRLLALPALLAVLVYLGLLVSYWSGLVGKEWAGTAALLLLAATWVRFLGRFPIHWHPAKRLR